MSSRGIYSTGAAVRACTCIRKKKCLMKVGKINYMKRKENSGGNAVMMNSRVREREKKVFRCEDEV